MFDISNQQIVHMVAQIRAKQLATKYSQDKVQKFIVEYHDEHPDISDTDLVKLSIESLESFVRTSVSMNSYLTDQEKDSIGHPIKMNKTHLQLNLAKKWEESQGEELITAIKNGKFYHKTMNTIAPDELPTLQSPSNKTYWGNENPSVSSILLASISVACDQKQVISMPGAATFFPFLNSSHRLPSNLIPSTYPFASTEGMTLFGDYQYGGHTYFKKQLLFGPEDCSSSVGKAINLTAKQIQDISTAEMITAFFNPDNEYHYRAITILIGDTNDRQLQLIEPGDIFLKKGHTAIIVGKPDNKGNIITVQFNRNMDVPENKISGGGVFVYNLCDEAKDTKTGIYILRPDLKPLHESSSLSQLLSRIDAKYFALFPNGPIDTPGDCAIFL
ncbi:uncharacterized protein RP439-like [Sitodiplosis mosellana]|uniref:uncharacterized protein RP439-like n=1 Tax=Sitodiplosis mosellana TaxID=263140 RepID=UPI00244458B8|nr:uncharacterized protein RP439-like [Sitodiplosis mosellana]